MPLTFFSPFNSVPCPAGQYYDYAGCTTVPAGSMLDKIILSNSQWQNLLTFQLFSGYYNQGDTTWYYYNYYYHAQQNSVSYYYCPALIGSTATGTASCAATGSCAAGYGLVASICTQCPAGSYSPGGSSACLSVPAGTGLAVEGSAIFLASFVYLENLSSACFQSNEFFLFI